MVLFRVIGELRRMWGRGLRCVYRNGDDVH